MRPSLTPAARRMLTVSAVGAGAVVSARALLRPRQGATPRLLDWDSVRRTAADRLGEGGRVDPSEAAEVGARCDAIAVELAPLMTEVTQLPLVRFPRFGVLDRAEFVGVNIAIARRLMTPIEEMRASLGESRATALGRQVMNRYIGVLFGIMARRVLGQYDPVLRIGPDSDGAEPALYLVEPNLRQFSVVAHAPLEPLRRWLILHELTHAWQFGEHPWLAEHLAATMEELVRSSLAAATAADGKAASPRDLVQRLPAAIRAQLVGIAQVQATMSLLEGYANFVMHRVGRHHLAHYDELEAAFLRRRAQRSPVERAVLSVTGVNLKLRQYETGERFCQRVTEEGGLSLLNRVWEGPAMLPSPAEVRDPSVWVRRATSTAPAGV
ncbi:MAG: zinc-dependent metalloprotease [Candidatus Dormibacteria bacterium]